MLIVHPSATFEAIISLLFTLINLKPFQTKRNTTVWTNPVLSENETENPNYVPQDFPLDKLHGDKHARQQLEAAEDGVLWNGRVSFLVHFACPYGAANLYLADIWSKSKT